MVDFETLLKKLLPTQELELLMEDLGTFDMTSTESPHPTRIGTSHRELLCGGLVCADYRCIPQGYRLVSSSLPLNQNHQNILFHSLGFHLIFVVLKQCQWNQGTALNISVFMDCWSKCKF